MPEVIMSKAISYFYIYTCITCLKIIIIVLIILLLNVAINCGMADLLLVKDRRDLGDVYAQQ